MEKIKNLEYHLRVWYTSDIITTFHKNWPNTSRNKLSKDQNSSQNTLTKVTWNFSGHRYLFTEMCFHIMPVKAVKQSHWNKQFDTVLPQPEWQKGLLTFGHVNSLKTAIEFLKQSLYLLERINTGRLENEWTILELYKIVRCALKINGGFEIVN